MRDASGKWVDLGLRYSGRMAGPVGGAGSETANWVAGMQRGDAPCRCGYVRCSNHGPCAPLPVAEAIRKHPELGPAPDSDDRSERLIGTAPAAQKESDLAAVRVAIRNGDLYRQPQREERWEVLHCCEDTRTVTLTLEGDGACVDVSVRDLLFLWEKVEVPL